MGDAFDTLEEDFNDICDLMRRKVDGRLASSHGGIFLCCYNSIPDNLIVYQIYFLSRQYGWFCFIRRTKEISERIRKIQLRCSIIGKYGKIGNAYK